MANSLIIVFLIVAQCLGIISSASVPATTNCDSVDKSPNATPQFVENPVNPSFEEGGNASLACTVKQLGRHKVAWVSKDQIILSIDTHIISRRPGLAVHKYILGACVQYTLTITNLTRRDEGNFMCHVNTDPIIIQHVKLVVAEKAEDTSEQEGITGTAMRTTGVWVMVTFSFVLVMKGGTFL